MNSSIKYQTIFYGILMLIVFALSLLIFWPFLVVLVLAAMISVILSPLDQRIRSVVKSSNLSALITILLLIVLIVVPLSFIGNQLINEAQGLYARLSSGSVVSLDYITAKFESVVQRYIPTFTFDAKAYLSGFSSWIVDRLGGIFSGTLDLAVKFMLMLVALFYFLRDGKKFKESILLISPFPEGKDKIVLGSLNEAIRSVMLGSVIIALIQGVLSGLGFYMFGVPNATLWGTVAGIGSLVPGVGTGLVWIPAVIYLFFYGTGIYWILQLVWSVVFVGLIDNFLGPIILNKGINIHPILILFSILGGLQFFGPEGFLLGPLVVSMLFALLRIAQPEEGSAISKKKASK